MPDTMIAAHPAGAAAGHVGDGHPEAPRRDFLKMVGAAGALIGVGAIAWPFVDSMNPAADVLALSSVEIDLAPVPVGSGITVVWRGKPVFVRHRTPEEIKAVQAVPLSTLADPASDESRVKPGKEQWLVAIGICTHLGCIPLGNKPTDNRGEYGGWACPCHGSQYDVSGRMRRGPAPSNLALPEYAFTSDTRIKIG